jgi:hypothetical protein
MSSAADSKAKGVRFNKHRAFPVARSGRRARNIRLLDRQICADLPPVGSPLDFAPTAQLFYRCLGVENQLVIMKGSPKFEGGGGSRRIRLRRTS